MQRYIVSNFDSDTFVVVDQRDQREMCICANYDAWTDAHARAQEIAAVLNESAPPSEG